MQKTYNILLQQENYFTKINLHLILCDAAVQADIKIAKREELEKAIMNLEIKGGGGTDFRPVFRHVDRLIQDKEFTNLKGVLYFTDGEAFIRKSSQLTALRLSLCGMITKCRKCGVGDQANIAEI